MSPDMLVRIAGRNDTSAAFSQVAKDAQAAGQAVKASGELAATGLRTEAQALELVGERSRAVAARSQNLLFQLNDIGVSLAGGMNPLMVIAQQGSQIAGIYGGQGGVKNLLGDLAGFATKLAPLGVAVGAIAGVFAGLTTKINETAKTQVNLVDVFLATVQLAAEGIGKFLKPAIEQLGRWWTEFVDFVAPIFKSVGNGLVGAFVGAFNSVKDTWSLLPAALGDLVIQAVNGVIGTIEGMINNVTHSINGFIEQINGAIQKIPEQFRGGFQGIGPIGDVGFGRMANPFAGAGSAVAGTIGSDFTNAMGTDYTGQAFDAISGRAQQLELASKSTDKLSGAMKAANDNAKLLAGGLKDVGGVTDLVAQSQQNMADTALGAFGQLTGGLSQLFKDNKAIAIANAVINTAEGITKALAQGGIFGTIAAAGIAASGAAQIAAIASANPGSASAPSVTSGGSAAAPGPAQNGGALNLTIQGSGVISVDEFAKQLAAGLADNQHPELARSINVIRAA